MWTMAASIRKANDACTLGLNLLPYPITNGKVGTHTLKVGWNGPTLIPMFLLLQACKVPVSILWGEADPWEPVKLGRTLALYPSVEEWASLPGKQGALWRRCRTAHGGLGKACQGQRPLDSSQTQCVPRCSGVGHCPQDEAPDQVNPFVTEFMRRHGGECATSQSSQRNLHASLNNSPLDSAAAKSA